MVELLTGEIFKNMIMNAAAALDNQKQEINDLNVFPVPDGDTGTNMSLTIKAAEKALEGMTPGTLGHAAEVTANAMLRGARGNSGVILSLLFRGFAKRIKDLDTADASALANALTCGVESAYNAVMKPAEGTILTVSRLAANSAETAAETETDLEVIFEQAIEIGNIALANTINQNPVLKKAGVIDAGAKGYMYILDGMLRAIRGEVITRNTITEETGDKADFMQFTTGDIKYAYCTEFIAERKNRQDTNRLRDFLDKRGDSVVVVDDDEIIKVHVHTNEPGVILTEALTYGPLLSTKIENMREQHTEVIGASGGQSAPGGKTASASASASAAASASASASGAGAHGAAVAEVQPEPEEMKEYGIVAVCAGEGIEALFRDLGADRIITGGQTMNPSTEDILEKIESTPANVVFVLPNNKNIKMAAEQCIDFSKKRVIVIPTKSIPQGVSAMLSVDEAGSLDEIAGCMTEASGRVRTALITLAARDSNFDGHKIKEGEYLALIEDSLTVNNADINVVVDEVATVLSGFSPEFITLFSGEDASEEEAAAIADRLGAASPGAELSVIPGGQPVYHYIISAE